MPPENLGKEEYGCPWQTISRLYELLAQVSAALGLSSVSPLFYSLSVQSVMHLHPCAFPIVTCAHRGHPGCYDACLHLAEPCLSLLRVFLELDGGCWVVAAQM